jgi:hypothetical protein
LRQIPSGPTVTQAPLDEDAGEGAGDFDLVGEGEPERGGVGVGDVDASPDGVGLGRLDGGADRECPPRQDPEGPGWPGPVRPFCQDTPELAGCGPSAAPGGAAPLAPGGWMVMLTAFVNRYTSAAHTTIATGTDSIGCLRNAEPAL